MKQQFTIPQISETKLRFLQVLEYVAGKDFMDFFPVIDDEKDPNYRWVRIPKSVLKSMTEIIDKEDKEEE